MIEMKVLRIIGALLIAALACFLIIAIVHYSRISLLCDRIEAGNNMETKVGNAYTAPRFLEKVFLIFDMSGRLRSPLLTACEYGNVQAVEVLLENGANPDTSLFGWNALENAAHSHCTEEARYNVFNLLISHGADVNMYCSQVDGEVIWYLADKIDHTTDQSDLYYLEQTILLLANSGSVLLKPSNWSLIHYIASCNDDSFMKKLLFEFDLKSNINLQTTVLGYSPLICAILFYSGNESEHKEMISTLLQE